MTKKHFTYPGSSLFIVTVKPFVAGFQFLILLIYIMHQSRSLVTVSLEPVTTAMPPKAKQSTGTVSTPAQNASKLLPHGFPYLLGKPSKQHLFPQVIFNLANTNK